LATTAGAGADAVGAWDGGGLAAGAAQRGGGACWQPHANDEQHRASSVEHVAMKARRIGARPQSARCPTLGHERADGAAWGAKIRASHLSELFHDLRSTRRRGGIRCRSFLAQSRKPGRPAAPAPRRSQCAKPDPHPGRLASREKMRGWNKDVQGGRSA
jgi:hypothetical protein